MRNRWNVKIKLLLQKIFESFGNDSFEIKLFWKAQYSIEIFNFDKVSRSLCLERRKKETQFFPLISNNGNRMQARIENNHSVWIIEIFESARRKQ